MHNPPIQVTAETPLTVAVPAGIDPADVINRRQIILAAEGNIPPFTAEMIAVSAAQEQAKRNGKGAIQRVFPAAGEEPPVASL